MFSRITESSERAEDSVSSSMAPFITAISLRIRSSRVSLLASKTAMTSVPEKTFAEGCAGLPSAMHVTWLEDELADSFAGETADRSLG